MARGGRVTRARRRGRAARARSRSCTARTRGWPTSRRRFTEAGIPFQVRGRLPRARGGAARCARGSRDRRLDRRGREPREAASRTRRLLDAPPEGARRAGADGARPTSRVSCAWRRSSTTASGRSRSSSPTCGGGSDAAATARGRAAPHLPPREGTRVRRGLPAAARGEGAAVAPGPRAGGDRRGAPAALRRDHAREAPALSHLVARREAQPVPGRARRGRRVRGRKAKRASVDLEETPTTSALRRWRRERARRTACRPTWSCTTRRSSRSPSCVRPRRPISPRCPESAPRSSIATATTCSPRSQPQQAA